MPGTWLATRPRARITPRKLPKLFRGARLAIIRPPVDLSKPSAQDLLIRVPLPRPMPMERQRTLARKMPIVVERATFHFTVSLGK